MVVVVGWGIIKDNHKVGMRPNNSNHFKHQPKQGKILRITLILDNLENNVELIVNDFNNIR